MATSAGWAMAAKAGAAAAPPVKFPFGSSIITTMTSSGSSAGTMPAKDAT